MSDTKQVVVNTMQLPLNENSGAVSVAVVQLLSEGWIWGGVRRGRENLLFIELTRRFEYDSMTYQVCSEAPVAPSEGK